MTTELFAAILIFLGAVLSAVLFILDRQGKRLADAIPPEIMPLMMGMLALAETLAAATPTLEDDQLIARIREALKQADAAPGTLWGETVGPRGNDAILVELAARLNRPLNTTTVTTTPNPVIATPEELAARLENNGAAG